MKENINENAQQSASQTKRIAEWLQQGHSITALEALQRFGCFRLTSRIWDIRRTYGWEIASERIVTPNGKRVASYRLINQN